MFDDAPASMGRSDNRAALTDAVARFQAEIRLLALAMARAAIEQELDARLGKPEPEAERQRQPEPRSRRKAARTPAQQLELGLIQQSGQQSGQQSRHQLDLPITRPAEAEPNRRVELPAEAQAERPPGDPPQVPDTAQPPGEVASEPPAPEPPSTGRKRVAWTRETITSELATWMLSGTAIDAQFMTRHGPRGLVAAIRRVFGRFEAALNVAALHLSKQYPDGPPAPALVVQRRSRSRAPA
jgi:hypothetical protein